VGARPAATTLEPPAAPVRERCAGRAWTCRPDWLPALRGIPLAAWLNPAARGWERVKHNGRREVWRAVLHGRAHYLKYYFCDTWAGRLRRLLRPSSCRAEWEGGLYAARAGIPAVRPVAYTQNLRIAGRRCDLLVTEAIEPALPLAEFWLQLGSDGDVRRRRADAAALLASLAQMIARAHQAGFEHLDMHAANILVQTLGPRRYRTVFVDLHSARRGVPLGDGAVVRNLAQLNQWFRKHSTLTDRLRFLRSYLRWRHEYEDAFPHARRLTLDFDELVRALARAAQRHAERLGTQRDHRIRRDGRYFTRLRLPGGWRGVAVRGCKQPVAESRASQLTFERTWWETQLRDPLHGCNGTGRGADLKNSHSAAVRRAVLPHAEAALPVILKHPRARNLWRRLVQALPPSRSLRGWRVGHALLHRDVPTARPLAVLERRFGPLVRDSLLVTEALPGALDLAAFLTREHALHSPTAWVRLKRELTTQLAAQLRLLQERGFDHRDCKAGNLLVVPQPAPKLVWIDMDGVKYARRLSGVRRLRPLARLHVSLQDVPGLTRTDRVRFLRLYFARFGAAADAWRTAWPLLARMVAEKLRTQAARRAWKLTRYGRQ
jgi:hypothetical protein